MANPAHIKYILHQRDREKRKRLIVLVRILTKLLDRTNRFVLLYKVKCVVREFSKHSNMGDRAGIPLHDCLENRLHVLIDDVTWTKAVLCLELYMAHRHSNTQASGSNWKDATTLQESKVPAKGCVAGSLLQV